jgi:hypothetical protein
MVALKLWFDTRFRFFIGLAVMVVLALLFAWGIPAMSRTMMKNLNEAPPNPKIDAEAKAEMEKALGNYETMIDGAWYVSSGSGLIGLLAIILALGSPLAKSQSVHLTLSLPVRRYRWPVGQAVLTIGLTLAMLFVSTAVLLAIGALVGHTYPPGRAALNVLLCVVSAVAWIGLTLAVGSFVLDKAKTALIVIPAKFLSTILFMRPPLRAWDIGRLSRPLSLHPSLAWQPLLLFVVCAAGGVVMAAYRYERLDY